MLTAITLKVLYAAGGAVVGWLAKHWHFQGALREIARQAANQDNDRTPSTPPRKAA